MAPLCLSVSRIDALISRDHVIEQPTTALTVLVLFLETHSCSLLTHTFFCTNHLARREDTASLVSVAWWISFPATVTTAAVSHMYPLGGLEQRIHVKPANQTSAYHSACTEQLQTAFCWTTEKTRERPLPTTCCSTSCICCLSTGHDERLMILANRT